MFLSNKYTKWYYALMAKRRAVPAEGYSELHHEIPKSLGGSNEPSNLVRLSAREHFIAHAMLVRMTTGMPRGRMGLALKRMFTACNGRWSIVKYVPMAAAVFAHLRESANIAVRENPVRRGKQKPMSQETKAKISVSRKKLMESGEVQKKISAALTGKPGKGHPMSTAQKAMVSAVHKGKKISKDQKKKLSDALLGKPQIHSEWSEARKAARSKAMSGVPQGPHSAETKKKIGDAHRGKTISDEQKLKLSVAQSAVMKKRWAEKRARLLAAG